MGFQVNTVEEAIEAIGKVVTVRYCDRCWGPCEVRKVISHEDDRFALYLDDGAAPFLLPDPSVVFEHIVCTPTSAETPAERVARLEAQVAELAQEITKARGEVARAEAQESCVEQYGPLPTIPAPAGHEWFRDGCGPILRDQSGQFGLEMTGDPGETLLNIQDGEGDPVDGVLPFDCLAAFVDAVRADQGKAAPPIDETKPVPKLPPGWVDSPFEVNSAHRSISTHAAHGIVVRSEGREQGCLMTMYFGPEDLQALDFLRAKFAD